MILSRTTINVRPPARIFSTLVAASRSITNFASMTVMPSVSGSPGVAGRQREWTTLPRFSEKNYHASPPFQRPVQGRIVYLHICLGTLAPVDR